MEYSGEKENTERLQMIESYLMVRLPEELDHHQAARIGKAADDYIVKKPVRHIVFDFEDTRLMDSSGVGLIVGRYKKVACFGGKAYAVNANERIRRLLQLSGLKQILNVIE